MPLKKQNNTKQNLNLYHQSHLLQTFCAPESISPFLLRLFKIPFRNNKTRVETTKEASPSPPTPRRIRYLVVCIQDCIRNDLIFLIQHPTHLFRPIHILTVISEERERAREKAVEEVKVENDCNKNPTGRTVCEPRRIHVLVGQCWRFNYRILRLRKYPSNLGPGTAKSNFTY